MYCDRQVESPGWQREAGRSFPQRKGVGSPQHATLPLRKGAELCVELSRRLTDGIIELLHRLASTSSENERLKAVMESSRPHMEALETASSNAYERAQALVGAETRVAELRGKLLTSSSSHLTFGWLILNDVCSFQLSWRHVTPSTRYCRQKWTIFVVKLLICNCNQSAHLPSLQKLRENVMSLVHQHNGLLVSWKTLIVANESWKLNCRVLVASVMWMFRTADVSRQKPPRTKPNTLKSCVSWKHSRCVSLCIRCNVSSLSHFCGSQTGRARLEATVEEYRTALSAAKLDHSNAVSEVTALTKQVMVAENRLSAKDAEIQDLHRQISDLRQAKAELERRIMSEASHSTADQQVSQVLVCCAAVPCVDGFIVD